MFKSLITVFLLLAAPFCHAHPHVFIHFDIKFITDDKGVTGVEMDWELDPMFSQSLLEAYDKNQNRALEKNEIKLIEKEAFSNVQNYHYFTYMFLENKPHRFYSAEKFSARLVGNEIHYVFTLPLEKPVIATEKTQTFAVEVYDETRFIWMASSKKVSVNKPETSKIDYQWNTIKRTFEDDLQGEVTRLRTNLVITKSPKS